MSPRLATALDIAYRAGRTTLSRFQSQPHVVYKADATPVTEADKQAERMIREELARAFPAEPVLGEEEGGAEDADDRWVLDPIDGTKSFIAGVPLYATLLSYEVDQQPVLGVCYFPALDEMLFAEQGGGAWFNGRPCRVSPTTDPARAIICHAGFKGMAQHGFASGLGRIAAQTLATRTWCDAYGHALVASGRVEAMIDPVIARWDISAISVIVEEAGGRFTDTQGSPGVGPSAVSSNGALHDWLLQELHGA